MGILAVLSIGLLLSGATGMYRVFSYFVALFIAAVLGVASIERNNSEIDLAPYSRLVVGLGAIFVIGLTGIWLSWQPGTTEYTYLFGLPASTLMYIVFLWLLPIFGAVYYAFVFPLIGSERIVDDIMDDVRQAQRSERYPLSPRPKPDSKDGSRPSRMSSDLDSDPSEETISTTPLGETDRPTSESEGGGGEQ